jgi:hypothetical protein
MELQLADCRFSVFADLTNANVRSLAILCQFGVSVLSADLELVNSCRKLDFLMDYVEFDFGGLASLAISFLSSISLIVFVTYSSNLLSKVPAVRSRILLI